MRLAIASLTLAALVAGAAQAQVPSTEPAAPATTTVAPQTAPAPSPDAATTAPAAPAAPAAPEAAPPAEPAPPPPTLPTTGTGAAVLSVLERICVPAVRGGDIDDLSKQAGLRRNRRDNSWSMALGDGNKNHVMIVQPRFTQKDVCLVEVRYPIGEDAPIITALNIWSFLHQPELILQANYVNTDPDGIKRVRKSWEHLEEHASTAVNFTVERKPDDSPLGKDYDRGMLYYQERTF